MVPVLVRVQQVQASATFLFPFRCVHCGFESIARVRSKGLANIGGNGFGAEEMEQRARDYATEACEKNAPELAPLGICPRCHGRDEAALAAVKRRAWGWTGLVLLVCYGIAAFAAIKMPSDLRVIWIGVALAIGAFGGHRFLRLFSWKWTEAPDRVDVMNERELAEALAAVPAEVSEDGATGKPDQ